jgi:hypothetical protein
MMGTSVLLSKKNSELNLPYSKEPTTESLRARGSNRALSRAQAPPAHGSFSGVIIEYDHSLMGIE